MTARPPIEFQSRTGQTGSDVFNAVVVMVRNRTGGDFHSTFSAVRPDNADCLAPGYDHLATGRSFGRLLNRLEARTGLLLVPAIERAGDDVAALTKRFLPAFGHEPAAMAWDILWRSAEVLDRDNMGYRLLFRSAPDGVTQGDWDRSNLRAEDVLSLIDDAYTSQIDRGTIIENAHPSQVRDVFRNAIQRLMGETTDPTRPGNLDRRQAFDWLKENEPIFWTLALLSFEPDQAS